MIRWTEIEAECDGYREGFVAIFRKYEGQPTDEKDAQGRTVKVSQSSFARHAGIPESTFKDWVKQAGGARPPVPRRDSQYAADGRRIAENASPETKAKLAAELVKDPEIVGAVAEALSQSPAGRDEMETALARREEHAAEWTEKVSRARANQKQARQQEHSLRYIEAEGLFAYAQRRLNAVLELARTVSFDEEERELLAHSSGKLRALLGLIDVALVGSTDVDWDAELASIASDDR